MRTISVMLLLSVALASPVRAMDTGAAEELERLDPQTRLEQRCDLEAMERIHKDPAKLVPTNWSPMLLKNQRSKATRSVQLALHSAARANGIICPIPARHRPIT